MNRQTYYNKYKRDQEAKRFYNSKAWDVCRTTVLIRDHYLCQECLDNKIIRVYDVVHHIKPLKDYPELALTVSNLICLCHTCHSRLENEMKNINMGNDVIKMEANEELG